MTDSSDLIRAAAAFWDREHQDPLQESWMEAVRGYVNAPFGGRWPISWFAEDFAADLRFGRALSIGCGTGSLERFLAQGLCGIVDAFDASMQSIATAQSEARAAGVGNRIHYFAADFNTVSLPENTYDIVFFHQSLHHVARLEKLLSGVLRSLKPGGLLYLDEYVGPSRIDWKRSLLRDARAVHAEIPAACRIHDELLYPIQPDDPSEGIRSGDILREVRAGFEITDFRGYGGNVLAVLYPEVRWEGAPDSLLPELVRADAETAARNGSYCAVFIARPKRGAGRLAALARYAIAFGWVRFRLRVFLKPKLLRIRLGLLRRLGFEAKW